MNSNGKIIVFDDDEDDLELIQEVFATVLQKNNYTNEILTFDNGKDGLTCLIDTQDPPFLIISDINMPKMDGFEIRRNVINNPSLRDKCVPYVFLTTSGNNRDYIKKSYDLSAQGYFTKPNNLGQFEELLTDILRYWKVAKTANRV